MKANIKRDSDGRLGYDETCNRCGKYIGRFYAVNRSWIKIEEPDLCDNCLDFFRTRGIRLADALNRYKYKKGKMYSLKYFVTEGCENNCTETRFLAVDDHDARWFAEKYIAKKERIFPENKYNIIELAEIRKITLT